MHWGLAGSVVLRGQHGYRWHQVAHRGCREWGLSGGVGVSGVVWESQGV